jgi:Holliday junction resolvasome RuvABC endonuclease subunit
MATRRLLSFDPSTSTGFAVLDFAVGPATTAVTVVETGLVRTMPPPDAADRTAAAVAADRTQHQLPQLAGFYDDLLALLRRVAPTDVCMERFMAQVGKSNNLAINFHVRALVILASANAAPPGVRFTEIAVGQWRKCIDHRTVLNTLRDVRPVGSALAQLAAPPATGAKRSAAKRKTAPSLLDVPGNAAETAAETAAPVAEGADAPLVATALQKIACIVGLMRTHGLAMQQVAWVPVKHGPTRRRPVLHNSDEADAVAIGLCAVAEHPAHLATGGRLRVAHGDAGLGARHVADAAEALGASVQVARRVVPLGVFVHLAGL